MLTAYSRVTVVTGERTIDLALPSGLPLADVIPQVMRFAAPNDARDSDADGVPTSWSLGRLGGPTLALGQTLADAGVLDGDVLELRSQSDDIAPAVVEDVRDAIEDNVDAAGGVWVTRTTRSAVVLVVSAFAGVGALTAAVDGVGPADLDAWPGAAASAALLVALAAWAARFARPADAQVATAVAMVWGALAGRDAAVQGGADGPVTMLTAVGVATVVALVAVATTEAVVAHAAAGVVALSAAAALGVADLLGATEHQSTVVIAVLSVLVVGVLPRVSLSVGGLASADYRVRHVGRLDLVTLRRRYRASNAVLVGALTGIALVLVTAGIRLDGSADAWDRALGLSLAAAALMRSRLFSRTQHVLPLRVAALVIAGAALARLAAESDGVAAWLVPGVAAVGLGVAGVASLPLSEITRARVKRTLNTLELFVVIDLVVVAAGALDVYATLGGAL